MTYDDFDIKAKIQNDNIKFINFQFCDFDGNLKCKTMHSDEIDENILEGIWFDGSSIELDERTNEIDMILKPDVSTFHTIEINDISNAFIFCDVMELDTKSDTLVKSQYDMRGKLINAIDRLSSNNYVYDISLELEFILLNPQTNLPIDSDEYLDLNLNSGYNFERELYNILSKTNINIDYFHHELSPGQYEISLKRNSALKIADDYMKMKYIIKLLADKYNMKVTFIPKLNSRENGSGLHIHQYLYNINGENVFSSNNKPSDDLYKFISGQLFYGKDITVFTNSNNNSYKRLVKGFDSPLYFAWGEKDKNSSIKIPSYRKPANIRLENKIPDTQSNIYLVLACLIHSGLDGITDDIYFKDDSKKDNNIQILRLFKEQPGDIIKITGDPESSFRAIPKTLHESANNFLKNKRLMGYLGQKFSFGYAYSKIKEYNEFHKEVTELELNKYLLK